MERNIFYVYDENKKVKEIRTRLTYPNQSPTKYIIQKPIQKENKIQYIFQVVSRNQFYENLVV